MRKLLAADPRRIRVLATDAPDAVPVALADGADPRLRQDLAAIVGAGQVHGRLGDLVRFASDASPYRLLPQVVVSPRSAEEVGRVLAYCRAHGRHATFRGAGTSLSGQSQSDDVLLEVREHFTGMVVEDDGALLRVRPGTVLAHANAVLARHGRRLGPDPASAKVATLGGVLANNSAGMRCTPERSAYATVRSLTFVLASGTVIDTARPDADAAFRAAEPELAQGLLAIRGQILADPALVDLLRRKYAIRNTTGYTMRAFLDASTPVEIFRRLLVGSEGTLAFIAEAVLETLPLPGATGLCWVHLPSMEDAVRLVARYRELGAEAVEMLQASSLAKAHARHPLAPTDWGRLPADGASLLVEFAAEDADHLAALEREAARVAQQAGALSPVVFLDDPDVAALSWRVRSELNSELALARPAGSTNIAEDICFPPDRLAEGVLELQELLGRYGYPTIVAGHAAYGNMHFSLTPMLGEPDGREKYGAFMEEFVALVIDRYGGSLKAEHGTGINMAPFVAREWGEPMVALMRRVKQLADPDGLLAPDVVLTSDAGVHLRRFKSEVAAHPAVDACIECGFCEAVCPSRHVTTTPRQRIVLARELSRQPAGSPLAGRLLEEMQYDVVDTCAVDGSCAVECPYGINTGTMVKDFREQQATPARDRVALQVARHWGSVQRAGRTAIAGVDRIQQRWGTAPVRRVAEAVRSVVSPDLVPTVPGPMPRAAAPGLPATDRSGAAAVYFPACVNRIFGRDPDAADEATSLPEALVRVSARAGRPVWIPGDVDGHCCGTIWSSKGYRRGREAMERRIATALLRWSDEGRLPVVVDASSCTHGLLRDVPAHLPPDLAQRFATIRIVDSVGWCRELLDGLETERVPRLTVHPGCSVTRLGLRRDFAVLAAAMAEEVDEPYGSWCCGTAGDRGLLHPELVESATREERSGLRDAAAYVGSNRTCEMGLRQATGRPYESVVLLLERLSRRSG